MKQNKYNDEIDKILYEYFKNNVSDEIPSSTKSVINETLKNLEKTDTKKTYINFYMYWYIYYFYYHFCK